MGGASVLGTGTYITLAATHYFEVSGLNLESNSTPGTGMTAGMSCQGTTTRPPYCGNGAMPFPNYSGNTVTSRGLKINQISDGTAYTILIAESREETVASWYSGRATYAVAHWPSAPMPPGVILPPMGSTSPATWTSQYPSINRGHPTDDALAYMSTTGPHGITPIRWGPSSRHDRVVVHGFADGHADTVRDDIAGNTYIHWVTRAGREITQAE
jgi:hypothetical protein